MSLESPEKLVPSNSGRNEATRDASQALEVIEHIGRYLGHIRDSDVTHLKEPLQLATIFISMGTRVKSAGILKPGHFFHIKKREEEINLLSYFSNE